jgi:amino acid transporter
MFLVAVGNLEILADTTVTLLLLVFVSVNIAVLVLRRDRVEQEHWRAPTALPAIGAAVSLVLVVQKLADDPSLFAYAGGLLVLGAVLWLATRALTGPVEEIDPAKLMD